MLRFVQIITRLPLSIISLVSSLARMILCYRRDLKHEINQTRCGFCAWYLIYCFFGDIVDAIQRNHEICRIQVVDNFIMLLCWSYNPSFPQPRCSGCFYCFRGFSNCFHVSPLTYCCFVLLQLACFKVAMLSMWE